jgi:hypothetical protein
MTRGTNLMQQLWFIITNNSTSFKHLVQVVCCCIWCSAPGVVSDWPVRYKLTHSAQDYTLAPYDHSHNTWCWTPYAATHNLYSWRWAYRCPKHVELFMIINHNCCIKLVPRVIFIYDARSHIHQYLFQFCLNLKR